MNTNYDFLNYQKGNYRTSGTLSQEGANNLQKYAAAKGVDITKPLSEEDAQKISAFGSNMITIGKIATINYALERGEISEEDAQKALKDETQMSDEGQSALSKLKEALQENYAKLIEWFTNNKETGENGEAVSSKENQQLTQVMADEIVTFEELESVTGEEESEEAEEAGEAAEAPEASEEEAPEEAEGGEEAAAPEEESEGHEIAVANTKEVIDAIFDDYDNGKVIDINNHPEILADDDKKEKFNLLVNDILDDGNMGNVNKQILAHDGVYGTAKNRFAASVKNNNGQPLEMKIKGEDGKVKTGTLHTVTDSNDGNTTDVSDVNKEDKKKKSE